MNKLSEGKASTLVRSNATRASTGFTTYQLRQTPSIYYLTNTDSDTSGSWKGSFGKVELASKIGMANSARKHRCKVPKDLLVSALFERRML